MSGGGSNEWFFLAMARWELGEQVQAREAYDRAVQWMKANARQIEVSASCEQKPLRG